MNEPDVLDDMREMANELAVVDGRTYDRHALAAVMMLACQEIERLRKLPRVNGTSITNIEPLPINTLRPQPGLAFIGLTLEHTIEGKPMWELDHYQFVASGGLINRNSSNHTGSLKQLTHWLPEPEFP